MALSLTGLTLAATINALSIKIEAFFDEAIYRSTAAAIWTIGQ